MCSAESSPLLSHLLTMSWEDSVTFPLFQVLKLVIPHEKSHLLSDSKCFLCYCWLMDWLALFAFLPLSFSEGLVSQEWGTRTKQWRVRANDLYLTGHSFNPFLLMYLAFLPLTHPRWRPVCGSCPCCSHAWDPSVQREGLVQSPDQSGH